MNMWKQKQNPTLWDSVPKTTHVDDYVKAHILHAHRYIEAQLESYCSRHSCTIQEIVLIIPPKGNHRFIQAKQKTAISQRLDRVKHLLRMPIKHLPTERIEPHGHKH